MHGKDLFDLCLDVFPWVSNQATCLGLATMDNRFAQLGGELFILTQQITLAGHEKISRKLIQIAELIDKACSFATLRPAKMIIGESWSFAALRRIRKHKDSNMLAEKILIGDIRRSLPWFVQQSHEYPSLLRLITECLQATEVITNLPDDPVNLKEVDFHYPEKINNMLYTQLRIHSTCQCQTQHLDVTRLRLDVENDKQQRPNVEFDLLFEPNSDQCDAADCRVRWKEAKISIAKPYNSQTGSQTSLAEQIASKSPIGGLRKVKLGELCKIVGSEKISSVHFHVLDNVMKLEDKAQEVIRRNLLPQAGIPLAQWLEQTVHLPNRLKVKTAYTIARSVWQYYSSDWMAKPWTHESIVLVKEQISDGGFVRPHLYLATKLDKLKERVMDYYIAEDLMHMYPIILALGVVLIEIAAKQPLRPEGHFSWNETTINDYYEWAWKTASSGDFGNTIGPAYEMALNNCLDAELFKAGPIDGLRLDKHLKIRRSLLYDKVVLPLQQLHHAYQDDWEIQETPKFEIDTQRKPHQDEQPLYSRPANRSQFSVAIFCALTLESDAVCETFEEIWDEKSHIFKKAAGDDNVYTLGRIGHHNVVLVHMNGMGKGAAAHAASSVRCSYPEIKLALVVGICGGVPSFSIGSEEIILGDDVISDGIVQYDFGRQFPDGFLSKEGPEVVTRPSPKLRGILSKLKGMRGRERLESKLVDYLNDLEGQLGLDRATYPGIEKDELFQPAYRHKHQDLATCALCGVCEGGTHPVCEEARLLTCQRLGCQKAYLVRRKRLEQSSINGSSPRPIIHFGLVGSGDTVMKSGLHRDKTATQHGLIAFEMEASGILDNLPCLVVKGVCDYADSHKNKDWQYYAAATAAACMKAVLCEIIL